ncbi:hypothetical protein MMC28_003034 [Mycoblastus sanguinarius]|nr:hypothetical protein [Mycoblastus sanguinarius]
MSPIQTHTQDPINPAYNPDQKNSSQPVMTATSAQPSYGYPPPRPGASLPAPTSTTNPSYGNGPPRPQPGAVPVPAPPATTAKPSLPPPPKAGHKPLLPGYYTSVQSTLTGSAQPQPYPPQMSKPPPGPPYNGIPPASATSTSTTHSFPAPAPPSDFNTANETPTRASLEHPPGYVQNPYASDMTPDQRFATEQQASRSGNLPSLGYNDNRKGASSAELEDEGSVWDTAKKWVKEKGEQANELHGQIWDRLNGGK